MSTFSDFALIAAVPSYGGAEILRAQRVLPMGPGPRVHLALFGRSDGVMRRVVYAANAAASILHPAIARIFEVARFDGVVYGVGDPSEGLDLAALLAQKRPVPQELALAVTAAVARVAVAVHDAAGPGAFTSGPMGLGAVLPGGVCPEGIFLEATGAVRLRPLATAGIDPDIPSAFRAPEEAISMPADVYGLGRLLAALLAGDPSGRQMPRLPGSSPLSSLLARMTSASPGERPHLHEATTKLEAALREQRVASADQAVRAALMGPYRAMVVDPVLSFGAPPHLVDQLRMHLNYIYGSIERLWPSMAPSMGGQAALPPPPPAFAALPPAQSDEGAAVFTDARPAVRRQKAKTAATVLFGQADVAAAVKAVSEEDAAFKPKTSPTMIIPTAELRKALPAPGARLEEDVDESPKTKIIDAATFMPFTPPPVSTPAPPPVLAPAPPSTEPGRSPPPPIVTSPSMPVVRPRTAPAMPVVAPTRSPDVPKRPPTNAALNVFAEGNDDKGDDDDRTQMLDDRSDLLQRLRDKEKADEARAADEAKRAIAEALDAADELDREDGDDDDGSGFSSSAPAHPPPHAERQRPMPPLPPVISTSVAPAPEISEPDGAWHTDAIAAVANADTALAAARTSDGPRARPRGRTAPALATIVPSSDGEMSDAFAAAFAPPPDAAATLDDDDDAGGIGPDVIDDASDFVMVGEAGRTFEGEKNPFKASTRFYPAQALQAARSSSDGSNPDGEVSDEGLGFSERSEEAFAPDSVEIRAPRTVRADEGDPKTELVDIKRLNSELGRAAERRPMSAPAATISRDDAPTTGQRAVVPNSETQRVVRPRVTSTQVSPPPAPSLEAPSQRREPSAASQPSSSPRSSQIDGSALSQLIVEAPDGATVSVNGTVVGSGLTTVDVGSTSRCVLKVTMPGRAPFSTVIMVGGKPRVRVKPVLKPR